VILQLGASAHELEGFTRDVGHVSPHSVVVGAYRVDQTSDAADEGQHLVAAMRCGIRDFLRRPLSSNELEGVIDRHVLADAAPSRGGRPGVVVDFVSNKGGVGKSTTSISAACLLARSHPGRVLLIDASLQLGVCACSLNVQPATTIVDAVRELSRLDETLLREISVRHESGLHVLAAPNDAVEATAVGEVQISRVLSVARQAFDYVLIDTFPLVDAVAVAGLDVSDLVYCVTSDTVPNVVGISRYIGVLERLGVTRGRMRIVLNHPQPRFPGALTPKDVASRLGRDIDHVIPYDRRVLVGLNSGVPYSLRASSWYGYGKAVRGLVAEMESAFASSRSRAEPRTAQPSPARELVGPGV
jgi:pilus assembly protein CpaE